MKKKHILTLFIILTFLVNNVVAQVGNWTDEGNYDTSWYNATDTEFTISTAEQLAGLAYWANINQNYFKGKKIKLSNDVDLGKHYWVPIGTDENPFIAEFDGSNHSISSMIINKQNFSANTGSYNYFGLFGLIKGATIKKVRMLNSSITISAESSTYSKSLYVGFIIGKSQSSSISSCNNFGGNITIKAVGAYKQICGGIIGANSNSQVINCSNNGKIQAQTNADIGGICGDLTGGEILNCMNKGEIYLNDAYTSYIGGICGDSNGYISNCYNMGKVHAKLPYSGSASIGGIAGFIYYESNMLFCYNNGKVTYSRESGSPAKVNSGDIYGISNGGKVNYCGNSDVVSLNKNNSYPCWVADMEPYKNEGYPYPVTVDVEELELEETSIFLKGELMTNIDIRSQGFEYKLNGSEISYQNIDCSINSFETWIRGLESNMEYAFRSYIITSNDEKVYSLPLTITTKAYVKTNTPERTQITATLRGVLNNSAVVDQKGFEYKLVTEREYTKILADKELDENFEAKLINMKPGTSYEYRAYIVIGGKNHYGDVVTFTLQSTSASVSNATDIFQTSACISGSYSVGDAALTTYGIQYGKSTSNYQTFTDTTSIRLTGLSPNTKYSYRSYVTTEEGGTVYSSWKEFTTKSISLTVQQADAISHTSAAIHTGIECDIYSNAEFGFEWRKFDAPELVPSNTIIAEQFDGKLSFRLKSLTPSNYYKYRGYCKYQDVLYYSEWIAFGTSDVFVLYTPEVVTLAIADIESNSIILQSYILEGSENILQQGFEYWEDNTVRKNNEHNVILTSGTNAKVLLDISALSPNTSYKYKAFAKTASGTTYGEEYSFMTPNMTGIEDSQMDNNSNIMTYPNPVKDKLKIKIGLYYSNYCLFNIYDQKGLLIKSKNLGNLYKDDQEIEIDLSELPQGIYIATIISKDIIVYKTKLIKK